MTNPMSGADDAVIRLRGVSKSYIEGVAVLDGVNLDVLPSTVTALIGANGSGKSTLVKILSGYHAPDKGSHISLAGEAIDGHVIPSMARAAGVRFVHQDSQLVPGLSVLENMLVGTYQSALLAPVKWAKERRRLQAMVERYGVDVDIRADAATLSLATAAKLSVLRAIGAAHDEHLTALILDEPTAALGRDDAREMLAWIRDLAVSEKVGVLLIGHRLDEILAASDRVAVLRSGRIVALEDASDVTHEDLVRHIVGRSIESYYPERDVRASGETVFRVEGLHGRRVRHLSFVAAKGEVIGVTGLPGSGFEDVPILLMDPSTGATGQITIGATPVDVAHASIERRIELGMALIPADRKVTAIATGVSVTENLSLVNIGRFIRHGILSRRAEADYATGLVHEYGVSPADPGVSAGSLSGGNQQKVVIAKWMSNEPGVLVLHEPTQAVDVGAKSDIFRLIASAAEKGMVAVISSVEYEDLAHLCNRVLVMANGVVTSELHGEHLSAENLTAAAFRSTAA